MTIKSIHFIPQLILLAGLLLGQTSCDTTAQKSANTDKNTETTTTYPSDVISFFNHFKLILGDGQNVGAPIDFEHKDFFYTANDDEGTWVVYKGYCNVKLTYQYRRLVLVLVYWLLLPWRFALVLPLQQTLCTFWETKEILAWLPVVWLGVIASTTLTPTTAVQSFSSLGLLALQTHSLGGLTTNPTSSPGLFTG